MIKLEEWKRLTRCSYRTSQISHSSGLLYCDTSNEAYRCVIQTRWDRAAVSYGATRKSIFKTCESVYSHSHCLTTEPCYSVNLLRAFDGNDQARTSSWLRCLNEARASEKRGVHAPEMMFLKARKRTYQEGYCGRRPWRELCNHGFYHNRALGDGVVCFYCGVVFQDISTNSLLLREHLVRHNCSFARTLQDEYDSLDVNPYLLQAYNKAVPIVLSRWKIGDVPWRTAFDTEQARKDSFRPKLWKNANVSTDALATCGFAYLGSAGLATVLRKEVARIPTMTDARYIVTEGTLAEERLRDDNVTIKTASDAIELFGRSVTNTDDAVLCHSCGLVLYDWRNTACPWVEHEAWSPLCFHVIRSKRGVATKQ